MRVLTVCLGNICRSPAAQGILEYIANEQRLALQVDSAGTAAYHIGKPPDIRSQESLAQLGIDISNQTARQVQLKDFYTFEWIVAMDSSNLASLKKMAPKDSAAQVVMFGAFESNRNYGEVRDPYYGSDDGFIEMRQHLITISKDFVEHLNNI
ncbi:low molecular weight phosphotyrosine protein phosphatase [Marinomonas piezotolerans]|uniref:protein-tyrosine-phosphatase n=1 Tax=Marinomonas piezotolerans TaxID=2213058 RepID=A0A370UDW9_9GAMM|nr:low molecular weight protein-tyrosine-phosphatase [Marinomonas piezotolerans]RDL45895.1 low molecular weight phosphotyrosine protein phosphatase [Marinomonas piezotolerans]